MKAQLINGPLDGTDLEVESDGMNPEARFILRHDATSGWCHYALIAVHLKRGGHHIARYYFTKASHDRKALY